MNTLTDAKTLHQELCKHFKLDEQGGRLDVRWPLMRRFCDEVLRPRTQGFAERSADRSKRRKTAQRERTAEAGGAASSAGGASAV